MFFLAVAAILTPQPLTIGVVIGHVNDLASGAELTLYSRHDHLLVAS